MKTKSVKKKTFETATFDISPRSIFAIGGKMYKLVEEESTKEYPCYCRCHILRIRSGIDYDLDCVHCQPKKECLNDCTECDRKEHCLECPLKKEDTRQERKRVLDEVETFLENQYHMSDYSDYMLWKRLRKKLEE